MRFTLLFRIIYYFRVFFNSFKSALADYLIANLKNKETYWINSNEIAENCEPSRRMKENVETFDTLSVWPPTMTEKKVKMGTRQWNKTWLSTHPEMWRGHTFVYYYFPYHCKRQLFLSALQRRGSYHFFLTLKERKDD